MDSANFEKLEFVGLLFMESVVESKVDSVGIIEQNCERMSKILCDLVSF